MQVPYIEIISYRGKNGSMARENIPLFIARLVGVSGKKRILAPWQAEGSGHPERKYAERDAKEWAELLGLPIYETTGPENASGSVPEDTVPL